MDESKAQLVTDRILNRIETQTQWDEYLKDFIKHYGDIFLKHNISLDAGLICHQLNMVKNRLASIEDTLDDLNDNLESS